MALILPKTLTTLLSEPDTDPQWLISPILPAQGITLLHGRFSLGKSPLTWKIAQCVSDGEPFFGLPVDTTGPVLYLEIDTPERQVKPRLKLLQPVAERVYMANGYPRLNLMTNQSQEVIDLQEAYAEIKPVLVIVNTLRKVHDFDQNVAETPNLVYTNLLQRFPKSAILAVHHDRKVNTLGGGDADESFSGAQAWGNDATVALHLRSINKNDRQTELVVTKSQVSATGSLLRLKLSDDGTNFEDNAASTRAAQLVEMWKSLEGKGMTKGAMVTTVMKTMGCSRATVYGMLQKAKLAGLTDEPVVDISSAVEIV